MSDDEKQGENQNYPFTAGDTGNKIQVRKIPLPFFGVQNHYLDFVEEGESLQGYGWDPQDRVHVVRIVYRKSDEEGFLTGEEKCVAGYISVRNVDLSSAFNDNKFRIGVDAKDVVNALSGRINLAQDLIDQNQVLNPTLLDQKLGLLYNALSRLNKSIDDGLTHIILATGWREYDTEGKFVDCLNLNPDFFNYHYPKNGFPIGEKGDPKAWINRDWFIWQVFPEGELTQVTGNQYEWKMKSNEFSNLKIGFNRTFSNIMGRDSIEVKMSKPWPSISEFVEFIEKKLEDHPQGSQAKKARAFALKGLEGFYARAYNLEKIGKTDLAKKNEDAAKRVLDAIIMKLEKELSDSVSALEKIDPKSDSLLKLDYDALRLVEEYINFNLIKGEADNSYFEKIVEILFKKFNERAKFQLDTIKKLSLDDPDFHLHFLTLLFCFEEIDRASELAGASTEGSEIKKETFEVMTEKYVEKAKGEEEKVIDLTLNTSEWLTTVFSLSDSLNKIRIYGSKDPSDVLEDSDRISEKLVEALTRLLEDESWNAEYLFNIVGLNQLIGESEKPDPTVWNGLCDRNLRALNERYDRNPKVDKEMKILIVNHVDVFKVDLPEDLSDDTNVKDFVDELHARERGEQTEEIIEIDGEVKGEKIQ